LPDAQICLVKENNLNDVINYEGTRNIRKYQRFLAQGDIGYYAYLNNQWVHRTWVKIGPQVVYHWVHFPPFRLESGEAYCHFGETVSSARGHNIAPAVLSQIALDLRNIVKHLYTRVDEKNRASQRAVEKAGFVEQKRQKVITLLGISFYRDIIDPKS
jgi:L-amino acid N-acyltransferase YncA